MSKQQVTNTWKDGLNSDLNPMITPNTVLTDNLNGTLITYNGNEFSLQNDMGNRQEGALSPGFYPIGIAENSGILYIASIKEDPGNYIKIDKPNFDAIDVITVKDIFKKYGVTLRLEDVYNLFTMGLAVDEHWSQEIFTELRTFYGNLYNELTKVTKFEIGSFPSLDPNTEIEEEADLDYSYRPFNNLLSGTDRYIIMMDTSPLIISPIIQESVSEELSEGVVEQASTENNSSEEDTPNRENVRGQYFYLGEQMRAPFNIFLTMDALKDVVSNLSWNFTEEETNALLNYGIGIWTTDDKDKWTELYESLDYALTHYHYPPGRKGPTMFYKDTLQSFSTYELPDYSKEYPVTIEVQPSYDGSVNLILNDNTQPPRLINSAFAVTGGGKGKFIKRHFGSRTNYYEEDKLDSQTRLIQNSTKFTYIDLGDGEDGKIEGIQTGGELKGGNYTFYLRYGDADGNKTDIVCESGIISVFNGTPGDPSSMVGTLSNELTDKLVWLTVNDIDTNYSKIYLSYTREYSDLNGYRLVEAKEIVEPYDIKSTKEQILINGLEIINDISVENLNIKYHAISGAKAIAQQQSMLFLGNVHSKEIDAEKLQNLSYKIKVTLKSGDKNLGYISPKDYKSHHTIQDLGEIFCKINDKSPATGALLNALSIFLREALPITEFPEVNISSIVTALWQNNYYKDSYNIVKRIYDAIENITPSDVILNYASFENVSINTLDTEVSSNDPAEYYDPKNIYYNLGYWPGDYYRFGVIYIKNDGTSTDVFDLKGCNFIDVGDDNYNEIYHIVDCTDLEDNTFLKGTQTLDNIKGVFKLYEQVGRIPVISTKGIMPYYLRFEFTDTDDINQLNKLGIIGYQIVRQKRLPSIICQGFSVGVSNNAFIPMLYNNYEKDDIFKDNATIRFVDPDEYYTEYHDLDRNHGFKVRLQRSYRTEWFSIRKTSDYLWIHRYTRASYKDDYDKVTLDVYLNKNLGWGDCLGRTFECIDPNLSDAEWSSAWETCNYFDGGGVAWNKNRFDLRTCITFDDPIRTKWGENDTAYGTKESKSICINFEKYKYLYIGEDRSMTFFNDTETFAQLKSMSAIKPNKYFTESFISNYTVKNSTEIAWSRNLYNSYGGGLAEAWQRTYIVQLEYLTNLYKNRKTAIAADFMMASGEPTIGTIGAIMRLTNQWTKSAQGLAVVTYVNNKNEYIGPKDDDFKNHLKENTEIYDCIVYVVRYSNSKDGSKAGSFDKALQKCVQYCEQTELTPTDANHWNVTLTGWPISEYYGDFKSNKYIYEHKIPWDSEYNSYKNEGNQWVIRDTNYAHENKDAHAALMEANSTGGGVNRYINTDSVFSNAFGLLSPEVTVTPELQSRFNGNEFSLQVLSEPKSTLYKVLGTNNRLFSSEQVFIWGNSYDDSSNSGSENLSEESLAKIVYIPRDTVLKSINFGQNSLSLVSASNYVGSPTEAKEFRFLEERPKPTVLSGDKETRDDIVRGQYTDFLLVADNTISAPSCVFSICVPDTTDGKNNIIKRANNNAEYYTITNKIPLTECVNAYRGDCYTNTVTVRMHKNFIDPTAPITDTIINRTSWKDNYHGLYKTTSENSSDPATNWGNINVSDLNTVDLGHWITFKCLANCNLALRSEDTSNVSEYALLGKPRSFYPHEGVSTATASKTLDTTIFNHGYDATVSRVRLIRKEHTPYDMNEFGTRVMFSNVDIISSFQNEYRIFQGMSYKDYPTTYGDIIKILPWGQNLFCVFEHGIAIIPVNPKALLNTTTEDTIHIYGYGVLPEDLSVISQDFGSIWADSVIRTPLGIYGVDTSAKKIWQYTDSKGLITISDMKIQRFLNDRINVGLKSQEKLGETNVKTHYNMYKGDVMFTFYNTDDKGHYEEWNLCYNERQGLWITQYSWTPLLSANVDNTFYSIELHKLENKETFGIWKHGRTGVDRLILPTKWYDHQEPFEFEFVAGEPMGIDKIFENLKITSNNVQPESFDFQIIGDDYLFNKARIYHDSTKEDIGEQIYHIEGKNTPYNSVREDPNSDEFTKETEFFEKSDYSPAFYNASVTYDKVLDEYTLVIHQDCKNKEKFGVRLGNIQYKENGWDTNIEPLRYNTQLKNPNIDYEHLDKDSKNFTSAKLRDKWLKVRIKYKGDRLAIIGAVTTVENISYA